MRSNSNGRAATRGLATPTRCTRVALIGLAALTLAACAHPRRPSGPAAYQPTYQSDFLAQTNWQLARWTRPGGALRPIPHGDKPNDPPITISFIHEGYSLNVAGYDGCNNYSSNYAVNAGQLVITTNPLTSGPPCSAPAQAALEGDYLSALLRIRTTDADNYGNPSRLTLTLDNGEILDFARRGGALPAQ
jgi:heat shock protein HslJ